MSGGGLAETLSEAVLAGPLIAGVLAAALAGLVSFASPCVVPLVPGYLSYLAGAVGGEMDYSDAKAPKVGRTRQWAVVGAAALFVAGFTVVFVAATVSAFGLINALSINAGVLMRVGGAVTVLMGLVFLGAFKPLQRDTRRAPKRGTTWLAAPLLGGVFAFGWTPCLGPTLAAIISVAAGTEGTTALRGAILIVGYCLGLGLPFVALALGSSGALRGVGWLRRHSRGIQIFGGVAMIVVGLLLLTGLWEQFINLVRQWTVEFGYAPI